MRNYLYLIPFTFFSLSIFFLVLQVRSNSDEVAQLHGDVATLTQQLRDHGIEPAISVQPAPVVVVPPGTAVPSNAGSSSGATDTSPVQSDSPATTAPEQPSTTTTQPQAPPTSTPNTLLPPITIPPSANSLTQPDGGGEGSSEFGCGIVLEAACSLGG